MKITQGEVSRQKCLQAGLCFLLEYSSLWVDLKQNKIFVGLCAFSRPDALSEAVRTKMQWIRYGVQILKKMRCYDRCKIRSVH